ncbi:Uncharacterised protein [Vibrio cholerae]|nr:Uncharacterised protein [Vibrio cholerae]CSC02140.1 Uncharacterised protein [Vibrio cholerae]
MRELLKPTSDVRIVFKHRKFERFLGETNKNVGGNINNGETICGNKSRLCQSLLKLWQKGCHACFALFTPRVNAVFTIFIDTA